MASAQRSGVIVDSRDGRAVAVRAPFRRAPRWGPGSGQQAGARLAMIVAGRRRPGIYRWLSRAHTAAVSRELRAAGWGVFPMDGRVVHDGPALLEGWGHTLAFPCWYQRHWDALGACLADLSWLPAVRGQVLLWNGYGTLARSDPQAWRLAYQTFAGALRSRQVGDLAPVFLLLRGSGPTTSPVDGHRIPLL